MLSKCCTQYVSKFGKPSSGHRTGKDQSSYQFLRRAVLKNVQTSRQLHPSPMLVRLCSKSCMLIFSITWIENFQMFKLGLEKTGIRDQIANICWIIEKAREFQKICCCCFVDYIKAFYCVDHNKLWKALKEMGIPVPLTCLLRNCMQVKKQQFEPCMEQLIGSRLRKEAVCGHPVCLTYMRSTSWEMPGWMSYKLESR